MKNNEATPTTSTRIYRLSRRIVNLQYAMRTLGQDRTAEIEECQAEINRLAGR
jgi:hypothetical protein